MRNNPSLGSYSSICLGSYGGPRGQGQFLLSEVPLYVHEVAPRGGFQGRVSEAGSGNFVSGCILALEGGAGIVVGRMTCRSSTESGWILTEQCGILWMPVTPESRRQVRIQEQGLRESQG